MKKTTAKKSTAKKPAEKKTAAKKPATKKATTKKSTAKKAEEKPAAEAEPKRPAKTEDVGSTPQAAPTVPRAEAADKPEVPDVHYSKEDLELFASIIQESRREALEELVMLKERLEDLTSYEFAEESMIYSMHMAEQGSEAMEKEKTYAQIQRINEYIKKLDEAMQRIKDKTYGICRMCGCLIAKERLMAVPITTLSASFKIHQKCPEDGIDRIEPVKDRQ
ncbi:MAG: TraR/DksA family transcriptional regulator [Bacteroidota bacterium]